MSSSRPAFVLGAALLTLSAVEGPASAGVVKFATLAPEGTDAMKAMNDVDKEVQARTGGALKFKMYAGGKQGEDKDIVRKIRAGQLQAGGFTGVGLGEIAPLVRILDAPWLFRDHGEVDHIYEKFAPDFEKALGDAGYVLLGWTEVGFIHIFSKTPVTGPEDIRKLKIWLWESDPIAEAAYLALGVSPKPLSVTDVMTSLQTGLIDSVYSAPLYAMALQWHEKTKFIHGSAVANASGAVLISKKAFNALPEAERKVLLEVSRKRLKELNEQIRKSNTAAMEQLKKQGLGVTPASPAALKAYEEAGRKARRSLTGRLYPAELLDRVEKSLEAYRAQKSAAQASKK